MNRVGQEISGIIEREDWDALGRFIDDRFISTLLTEFDALDRAVEAVPEQWLLDHPRYVMSRAILRSYRSPLAVIDDESDRIFRDWVVSQPAPAARDVLGLRQTRLRFLLAAGRYEAASSFVDELARVIDEAQESSGFHDVLPSVLLRCGLAKLHVGDAATALGYFHEARRWCFARTVHPIEPYVRSHIALALALGGDYTAAREQLSPEHSTPHSPAHSPALHYEMIGALARGLIALGGLDREGVQEVLPEHGDPLASQGELAWMWLHVRSRYALYWGDRHGAILELENRLAAGRGVFGDPGPARFMQADLADLYTATGNLSAAEDVLGVGGTDNGPVVLASRVRLHLLRGDLDSALESLAGAEHFRSGRMAVRPVWSVLQAAADFEARPSVEFDADGNVLRVIRRNGALNLLPDVPATARRRFAERLELSATDVPDVYPRPERIRLTAREREILEALRSHESATAIALALHISVNTVKSHLRALYRKLGVHTRENALRVADLG